MVFAVLQNKNYMKKFVRKWWKNFLKYLATNLSSAHLFSVYF